ncbi:S-layer protein, partial [Candidatus Micrarchaeota archaeon]|nr:S-layer protein [Candidatus Micrarchaeota archaeon]
FFSNGEPQVKIVVGAGAAASDGVAAANIAAMIGNLAYTSRAIEIQGQDQLVCTGGAGSAVCTLGDKSATLEITTPGVNPAVAYEMKTYIEDFINWHSPYDADPRNNYGGVGDFPATAQGGYTAGTNYAAKRITNAETPLLYSGYIQDNTASKKYQEEERVYAISQATWVNADKKVESTPPRLAYHIQFVDPLPFCTTIKSDGTCADSDLTINHHVKMRFLGDDWTIVGIDGYNKAGANADSSTILTLGKEITTNGLMQVGDSVTDSITNYSVKLVSVSPFSTTTTQKRDAQFQAFDGSGNLVGTYRILEGDTDTVAGPSIVIKVNKLFSGTGGVANADVTLFSQKLEIKGSGNLDTTDNKYWQSVIELYNSSASPVLMSDSIKGIRLTRTVSTNYLKNPGDNLPIVDKPQALLYTYTGLTTVDSEPLQFTAFKNTINVPSISGGTESIPFGIQITAARTGAFQINSESATTLYLNPSWNGTGYVTVYYLKSNGFFGNESQALGVINTTGAILNFYYSGSTNAAKITLSSVGGLPTVVNANITVQEPTTASDALVALNTQYGRFRIPVNSPGSTAINFLASGSTAYALYQFNGTETSNDLGYITPRGSVYQSLSSSSAAIDFAKTIQYATFTLSRSSASATGNVAEVTKAEGEEYDIGSGYKVKVKTISATATATGEVAGATVSAESLAYLTPNPSSADSVVALNTATNPLVVLDSDPMAAATSKLIVVGGPMVNTVAVGISGSDAISTAGSTPVVKAVGDKILVAGYTAADTKAAADSLIAYLASMRESITTG